MHAIQTIHNQADLNFCTNWLLLCNTFTPSGVKEKHRGGPNGRYLFLDEDSHTVSYRGEHIHPQDCPEGVTFTLGTIMNDPFSEENSKIAHVQLVRFAIGVLSGFCWKIDPSRNIVVIAEPEPHYSLSDTMLWNLNLRGSEKAIQEPTEFGESCLDIVASLQVELFSLN